MDGERFDVPAHDTLVLISRFEGDEVFRIGCCYLRGMGRIFYFRPGHETCPVSHQDGILEGIENGVARAAPIDSHEVPATRIDDPFEPLE